MFACFWKTWQGILKAALKGGADVTQLAVEA